MKFLAGLIALVVMSAANTPAATLLVSNTNDNGAGSLRQAVLNNNASGGNTIIFSNVVTGTITLTSGELLIESNVTILGPGSLVVSGNFASRVFHITNAATVAISGLAIANGVVSGTFPGSVGAGIWNDHSTLTLSNCAVTNNQVPGGFAGGIFNDGSSGAATLSIIASTISGNVADSGGGGGIYNYSPAGTATVSINASTFNNNNGGNDNGGGIINDTGGGNATITVSNSTFRANSAGANGGAIANNAFDGTGTGTVTVVACTFSTNTAVTDGGAIYNNCGSTGHGILTVIACTFNGNRATTSGGGSIYNLGSNAHLEIGDTILKAGLTGGNLINDNIVISDGYNLSSDNGGTFLTNSTDQINTDPLLGPLGNYGGPTLTFPLLPGSPALDKGKSFGLTTDQRGSPRPFDLSFVTNASGGDGSDIGAFELGRPPLSIQQLSTNAVLSWPSFYTNYTLQSSTNIASSNNWVTAGGTAGIVGSQYQQTNGPISRNRFFRLKGN